MGPEQEAALERGRAVSNKSGWDPVSVAFRGRLVAECRRRDETERVYIQGGVQIHPGQDAKPVRDADLRRVVKAMIGGPLEERADLFRECHAEMSVRVRERAAELAEREPA